MAQQVASLHEQYSTSTD